MNVSMQLYKKGGFLDEEAALRNVIKFAP